MASNKEEDFSGGRTDYYLDPAPNKASEVDNFLVTKDATLTVRPGFKIFSQAHPRIASGTSRVGKVLDFLSTTFIAVANNLYRFVTGGTGWVALTGPIVPATDVALPLATVDNFTCAVPLNDHLFITSDSLNGKPRKLFRDINSVWRIVTAGLPKLAFGRYVDPAIPSIIIPWPSIYRPGGSPNEGKSYLYFFCLARKYTVSGGVEYQDIGPVEVFSSTAVMPDMSIGGGGRQINIAPRADAVWPSIVDGPNEFYTGAGTVVIKIYRTKTNGTVGYFFRDVALGYVGEVADTTKDSALGEEIYIAGDVLDWDPPPKAKYMTQTSDVVWYGNLIERARTFPDTYPSGTGNQLPLEFEITRPYRLRQSIRGSADKCPAGLFVDVDGEITGLSSVGDYPIVFSDRKIWRLEGVVDTQGNGFTRKILVSDTVGCISNDSIAQSQRGIAFAGNDGFYFTDGFSVTRISDDLALTYPTLTSDVVNSSNVLTVAKALRRKRIFGAYDRATDRYWWAVHKNIDGLDNDSFVIWDSNFGSGANATFTSASSGLDMKPTAGVFVNGDLIQGDARGYVLRHNELLLNDTEIESTGSVATWFTKAVPYDYQSGARSMGDSTMTKWARNIQVVFVNETDVSVLAQTCDDDDGDWRDLKEMRFRGHYVWGQEELIWGDAGAIWNYRSFVFFERRFPRGSLRFTYKQIRFRPAYTVILASGDGDLAAIDNSGASTGTATLTGLFAKWGADFAGYYLHLEWDNYATSWRITAATATVATLADPGNILPSGSYRWEVRGYRKGERLILKNHVTNYEPFGDSQRGWRKTDGAGNG